MTDETISIGSVSRGSAAGTSVGLPVADLLTGRGFVTGASGSGKSNSASVVAEKLLDRGYSLLVVDVAGEYYGLKEAYEILHVGGDDECDLKVSEAHAGKLAELALDRNVPIILDLSGFVDESAARGLLTAVTRELFVKERKRRQPFPILVEEVHRYLPRGDDPDECGRMLAKVGRRGRKHGLGIVGISRRPAAVGENLIANCDWVCWHRLSRETDTNLVERVLGPEYATHVSEMDDGECFLATDWSNGVRVVQVQRRRTFDAGATPGLHDGRRPTLERVPGNLLEELREITDERERHDDRIEELERELEAKDDRIRELEAELSEARDLSQMADRFSRAMMEQATGRSLPSDPGRQSELDETNDETPASKSTAEGTTNDGSRTRASDSGASDSSGSGNAFDLFDDTVDGFGADGDGSGGSRDDKDDGVETTSTNTRTPSTSSTSRTASTASTTSTPRDTRTQLASRLRAEIAELDDLAVTMLRHYRDHGPTTPQDAHAAVGGSGDRTRAYATNRKLRQRGLVEHVGRGAHDYALPSLVVEESADPFAPNRTLSRETRDRLVREIESCFVPDVDPSNDTATRDGNGSGGNAAGGSVAPWPDA